MRLVFKQKLFKIMEKFDIFNENDEIVYTMKQKFNIVKEFNIYDATGTEVAKIKQKMFTWLPKYKVIVNGEQVGLVKRKLTFFRRAYAIDHKGWSVEGNILDFNYTIKNGDETVAVAKKQWFKLSDCYTIDIEKDEDALDVLCIILAIDADKSVGGK